MPTLNARPIWAGVFGLVLMILLLLGCQPSPTAGEKSPTAADAMVNPITAATPRVTARVNQEGNERASPPPSPTTIPTATSTPTPRATATPTVTATALPTATATAVGPCDQRIPEDNLLTILTLEYGVSRDYVPKDLVPLAGHLPSSVTLGYPTEIRQVVLDPLIQMIDEMHAVGLEPTIISGYRSYPAQSIAWSNWLKKEPDRAVILSAPPGHSEHQLGTTLDFGSPELPEIVGVEDIEFHTYFYMTSESIWLADNAHNYGFTLSFPRKAFELTGFYYEPWHYRYVGVELATYLKNEGSFLTQYQLETQPVPCIP